MCKSHEALQEDLREITHSAPDTGDIDDAHHAAQRNPQKLAPAKRAERGARQVFIEFVPGQCCAHFVAQRLDVPRSQVVVVVEPRSTFRDSPKKLRNIGAGGEHPSKPLRSS